MGLNIIVGILADLIEADEEGAKHYREEFAVLSRYLPSVKLQPHVEPPDVEVWSCDMYGYSGLHYLRRLAAHLQYSGTLPSPGDKDSAHDPLLNRYFQEYGRTNPHFAFGRFDHLIVHSDAEGYYIPQDFSPVLIPGEQFPVAGGWLGSSLRLQEECRRIAAALELPLEMDPEDERVYEAAESQGTGETVWERYGRESYGCLRLYHAAAHSIATGAAIVFS